MKVNKTNDDILSAAETYSNTEYSITFDQNINNQNSINETNDDINKFNFTILKEILYFIIGFTPIAITSIILYIAFNDYNNFCKYQGLVIFWCIYYLIIQIIRIINLIYIGLLIF